MSAVQVQRIFVQDTIPPAIVCPPNITLQANQTCTAVLGSFPYSATDNCPEILTSYLRSGATAGNGVGVPVGLSFNAGLTTVTLVATDGVGNTAACSFTVQVVNCAITLGGQITFEHNNAPVPNATVNVTGDFNGFSITNTNGNFNVSILSGSNFVVRPTKPINPLNGVTTADGLAIFQHASGGAQLPAPFKRIAADVQKDNDIDAADANVIFQALQGNSAALQTLASSWRFIPKSHVFPNPNIPWGFPEHIALNGVSGPVTNLNFTGVKLGDVTGDANPALRPGPPVVFYAQDRLLQSGSEITVKIRVKDFEQLAAWQTAFGFNPEVIAFAGGLSEPESLQSRSSHLAAELGRKRLKKNDELTLGDLSDTVTHWITQGLLKDAQSTHPNDSLIGSFLLPRWSIPEQLPGNAEAIELYAFEGRHYPLLGRDQKQQLWTTVYRVSPNSNRQGLRLEGPSLAIAGLGSLPSEPVRFGTVQLPAEGVPYVLLSEHQTTGGYPRVLEICASMSQALAQAGPGVRVRFKPTRLSESQERLRKMRQELDALTSAIDARLRS